jgi:hypothetical protein
MKKILLELYDNDQIGGIGENELIGSCSFIPNEFISDSANQIKINSSGVEMTLNVEWLQ